MPNDDYVHRLETQLSNIDKHLDRTKEAIENGALADRVKALEEWSQLRIRKEELAERIEAAKKEGAENWSAIHASFREEADALSDTLERWLMQLS